MRGLVALLIGSLAGCDSADQPAPGPGGSADSDTNLLDTGTPSDSVYWLRAEPLADYPTVVDVLWSQTFDGPATVEYSFDPDVWLQAPTVEGVAGRNQTRLVGLPYGNVYVRWRVVTQDGVKEAPERFLTPAYPDGLARPELRYPNAGSPEAETPRWDPEHAYLLTSVNTKGGGWNGVGPYYVVIYDRKGRAVWAQKTPRDHWSLYPQLSVSGDHLIYDDFEQNEQRLDDQEPGFFWYHESAEAVRTHLDGEIERVPMRGHHHGFVELPDGTLAWGSKWRNQSEQVVERAPGATEDTVVWNCRDWTTLVGCVSNSLIYRPGDDTYAISFYALDSIAVFDRTSADTLWWAGNVPDGFAFVPDTTQFFWQHGVFWTDAGTLMVTSHDADKHVGDDVTTTLAYEYEVDPDAGTLTRVWSYDLGRVADHNGDIRRLDNGHTLIAFGSAGAIREVDAAGDPVWFLDFQTDDEQPDRVLGRSQFLGDLYALLAK